MAYSSVSIIALVVLFITNYDLLFKRRAADKIPARRHYRFFLISVGFFYISDALWGLFETYDIHFADYAITVSFFAIMSMSVCLWTFYVVAYLGRRKFFSPFLKIVGLVLLTSGLVLIIVNFFHPIMFRFVETIVDGVTKRHYQKRGPTEPLFLHMQNRCHTIFSLNLPSRSKKPPPHLAAI